MHAIPAPIDVGPLTVTELDEVVAIEAASFTNPWTREMFREELSRGGVGRAWVARRPGVGVVGYCLGWLVAGELHISNVAIRPDCRRQGLGWRLLNEVLAASAAQGAVSATLEVRRSNVAACNLYERLGFRVAGVRARVPA